MTMNRRIECRSEGCTNEVLLKTVDGTFVDPHDRRGSGGVRPPPSPNDRGSPLGPQHRYSNGSIQVSPYCRQDTCVHFHTNDRCIYKKPPHDTVCAIHARCPVENCNQARAQFLDPSFDPLSNSVPRYARYEVCSDHKCTVQRCPQRRAAPKTAFCQAHNCQAEGCTNQLQDQRNCCEEHQCKTRGCRTIVEGRFPYCAIHIKCGMNGCGEARHFSSKTSEYLAHCTNHATSPRGAAPPSRWPAPVSARTIPAARETATSPPLPIRTATTTVVPSGTAGIPEHSRPIPSTAESIAHCTHAVPTTATSTLTTWPYSARPTAAPDPNAIRKPSSSSSALTTSKHITCHKASARPMPPGIGSNVPH
ncbi:hypothetical protein VTK56DRAFT_9877 [Thermocarpiscus australiensis]